MFWNIKKICTLSTLFYTHYCDKVPKKVPNQAEIIIGVARKVQGCSKNVFRMLQGRLKGVSMEF